MYREYDAAYGVVLWMILPSVHVTYQRTGTGLSGDENHPVIAHGGQESRPGSGRG
jgi:hypothetical protein